MDSQKDKIIMAALPHAAFDGWNRDTLALACKDAGLDDMLVDALFPRGVADAVAHFADLADRKMLESLTKTDPAALKVRERVKLAIETRLEFLVPHKQALRAALGYWSVPTHAGDAAKAVWRTADRIWLYAGDTATDYNRYTKRGLLSGVIASTTMFWLNDNHPAFSNTRAFLDRRIAQVLTVGKAIGGIKARINPFAKAKA